VFSRAETVVTLATCSVTPRAVPGSVTAAPKLRRRATVTKIHGCGSEGRLIVG
jgi:hypothetical protein